MIKELIIFNPSIEGGGVEKNLFIISNYLSKKFENVSLITSDVHYKNQAKSVNFIKPLINLKPGSGRKLKYLVCILSLVKKILFKKKIVVFSFQANLYCIIICKIFNTNIITRSNSSPSGWSKNMIKNFLYEKILKLADDVMVNSLEFKKEMKKKFNVNAKCIYNPLNKNEIIKKSKKKTFKVFKKKKSLKIINIGRFVDQKDQITILRALSLIRNKINFEFVLVGRGILKENLLNFVYENKLQNNVKFINFHQNPYSFLRQSDLFVLSSKFEGLPNVLLESATLKKYIISTDCPTGPKEILINGKGGTLYKIGDYKKLAYHLLNFKKNQSKIKKKINLTYNNLYRFDSDKNLKKYYKFILNNSR